MEGVEVKHNIRTPKAQLSARTKKIAEWVDPLGTWLQAKLGPSFFVHTLGNLLLAPGFLYSISQILLTPFQGTSNEFNKFHLGLNGVYLEKHLMVVDKHM